MVSFLLDLHNLFAVVINQTSGIFGIDIIGYIYFQIVMINILINISKLKLTL